MRGGGTRNQEDDEYEEEGPSSAATTNNSNHNSAKDEKNIDKVSAMRSKHSVTEQRRRSKINERFQILRDLIPHGDQKRDTASFLLEVIEYVQFLQEKVQKCEGSYQGWSPEPSKLIPWRNSHWRGHSFVGNAQAVNNGCGPGPVFSRKLDEDNRNITPTMQTSAQNPVESDPSRLLSTLTQALQTAGVDLSQANISVQIDVGNRVNKGLAYTSSATKDPPTHGSMHVRDLSSGEDSDPAQKRPKM